MSSRSLDSLIASYADQQTLTSAEYVTLYDSMLTNSDLVSQIMDDRAVDGVLSLIAANKSGEDEFISRCLNRLPVGAVDEKRGDCLAPIANDSIMIDTGSVASTRLRSKKSETPSRFRVPWWVSLAACALIAASITARLLTNSEDKSSIRT